MTGAATALAEPLVGAILAGGASRRMGREKALAMLGGKPLLGHVIDRLRPQVHELVLSVECAGPELAAFGLRQVPDEVPGHRGPLGGLLAAMTHYSDRDCWIVLAPCDAPFLPLDLAACLHRCVIGTGAPAAIVVSDNEPQPTFSLWHSSLKPRIAHAVLEEGRGGFKEVLADLGVATCDWPEAALDTPPPFFNVNDPVSLERAGSWLAPNARREPSCSV